MNLTGENDTNTFIAKTPSAQEIKGDEIIHKWQMFYRHGMQPFCQKGFEYPGNLRDAQQRAMRHCEIMGYRFIMVRPLISDIDEEERQKIDKRQGEI